MYRVFSRSAHSHLIPNSMPFSIQVPHPTPAHRSSGSSPPPAPVLGLGGALGGLGCFGGRLLRRSLTRDACVSVLSPVTYRHLLQGGCTGTRKRTGPFSLSGIMLLWLILLVLHSQNSNSVINSLHGIIVQC